MGVVSRLDMTEERPSELENRSIETSQIENSKGGLKKKTGGKKGTEQPEL